MPWRCNCCATTRTAACRGQSVPGGVKPPSTNCWWSWKSSRVRTRQSTATRTRLFHGESPTPQSPSDALPEFPPACAFSDLDFSAGEIGRQRAVGIVAQIRQPHLIVGFHQNGKGALDCGRARIVGQGVLGTVYGGDVG